MKIRWRLAAQKRRSLVWLLVPSLISSLSGLAVVLGAPSWIGAFAALSGAVSGAACFFGKRERLSGGDPLRGGLKEEDPLRGGLKEGEGSLSLAAPQVLGLAGHEASPPAPPAPPAPGPIPTRIAHPEDMPLPKPGPIPKRLLKKTEKENCNLCGTTIPHVHGDAKI